MTNREYYKDDPLALHRAWKNRKNKETSFETFLKLEHVDKMKEVKEDAIICMLGNVAEMVRDLKVKVEDINHMVEDMANRA